jgi:glycosyltransferase involved in cell wall biosynthesis
MVKRPRLLFIGNFLSGSRGSYAVCEALSARLQDEGWTVLTASRHPGRLPRLLDMLGAVTRERHAYDVAHVDVFSGAAFLWAEMVCAMLRLVERPFILSLHGGALPEFARAHPWRVRRLLRTAHAVTAPSRFLREGLADYCPGVRVHPNPIDAGYWTFRLRSRPAPRLIWVRAFHDTYNPAMAIAAVAILKPQFPGITLTMIGPDKGDGSLERARMQVAAAGLDSQIRIPGGMDRAAVGAALEQHDIFLNTSNTDNTPVSVLEALAGGLPAVSTRAGGVPHLLVDQRDALLVPIGDSAAMANAIARLLTTRGLAESLSSHGRLVAERHDWTRVLPLWEQLFTSTAFGELSHE